jgi:hypothetical protein
MSGDEQFIIALVAALVPVIISVLTYRKTAQTHEAVDGLATKNARRANRAGALRGRADAAREQSAQRDNLKLPLDTL